MDTITALPVPTPAPELHFDFAPHGDAFIWVSGETVYFPIGVFYTPLDTPVTFTATAAFFEGAERYAVAYEWDFGDGARGFGNPVSHTYTMVPPNAQAVLTVIDNVGRVWHAPKQLYWAIDTLNNNFVLAPIITSGP